MNYLLRFIVCAVVCLLSGLQLSAQCSNIANKNRVQANNHFFSGDSFGQSIVADAACYSGNHWNQPHDVTVRVITEGLRELGGVDDVGEEQGTGRLHAPADYAAPPRASRSSVGKPARALRARRILKG